MKLENTVGREFLANNSLIRYYCKKLEVLEELNSIIGLIMKNFKSRKFMIRCYIVFSFLFIIATLLNSNVCCSNIKINKKEEMDRSLIILRGCPAVGKSTIAKKLQAYLIKNSNVSVAYLPWDTFFHFVQPWQPINDTKIIKTTDILSKTAKEIAISQNPKYIIIEGVFLDKEEIKILKELEIYFSKSHWFRIESSLEEQLKRNLLRASEDYLEEDRIKILFLDKRWERKLLKENIIDNNKVTVEQVVSSIVNQIR